MCNVYKTVLLPMTALRPVFDGTGPPPLYSVREYRRFPDAGGFESYIRHIGVAPDLGQAGLLYALCYGFPRSNWVFNTIRSFGALRPPHEVAKAREP